MGNQIDSADTERKVTTERKIWLFVTGLLTCWVPTICLARLGKIRAVAAQIAWREKLALNIIIGILSVFLLFLIIGLSMVLCPKTKNLSPYEIESRSSIKKPLVVAYGNYYKINKVLNDHVNEARWLTETAFKSTTLGRDVSAMFLKPNLWSKYCGTLKKPIDGWDNIVREIPEKSMTVWMIHNGNTATGAPKDYLAQLKNDKVGMVALGEPWIKQFFVNNPRNGNLLVAYDRVYDVTSYMDTVFNATFLGENFRKIIETYGQTGKDVTSLIEKIKIMEGKMAWQEKMNCMDAMFLVGAVDHRGSSQCLISDYITLGSSIFVVLIIGFKFFAAVTLSSVKSPEKQYKPIICCIPCFTEGYDSLSSTVTIFLN